MTHEHGDRDDEEVRGSTELTSGAEQTGVVGDERAIDRSGLLGRFRSPSTAGLAGPEPPNRTGLTGGPGASDRSGLLGRTRAPDQHEREEERGK